MLDRIASIPSTSTPLGIPPLPARASDNVVSPIESWSPTTRPVKRPTTARTKQRPSAAARRLEGLKQPDGACVTKRPAPSRKPPERKRLDQKPLCEGDPAQQQTALIQGLFERVTAMEIHHLAAEQKQAAAENRLVAAEGEIILLQDTLESVVDYGDQQIAYLNTWAETANSALVPALMRDRRLKDEVAKMRQNQLDLDNRIRHCERQAPVRPSYQYRLEAYAGGPAVAASAPTTTVTSLIRSGASFFDIFISDAAVLGA